MNDWIESLLIFGLMFLGVLVAVFLLVVCIVNPLLSYSCHEKAEKLGLESQYSFWTDCLVKVDTRWIDIENYNEVGVK